MDVSTCIIYTYKFSAKIATEDLQLGKKHDNVIEYKSMTVNAKSWSSKNQTFVPQRI